MSLHIDKINKDLKAAIGLSLIHISIFDDSLEAACEKALAVLKEIDA